MKKIFVLKKENLIIAKDEILALTRSKKYMIRENILTLTTTLDLSKRLAQTRSIHQFLFSCNSKDIIKKVSLYDWNKVYKKDFYIVVIGAANKVLKDLANIIGSTLNKPRVNTKNSTTKISFYFTKKKVFCGLHGTTIKEPFESRKAHHLPEHHPTMMHPRLARTLINLTGIRAGTLVDPMCGAGGILAEAGLMGLKPVGYDIDPVMIRRCKNNLTHHKVKATLKLLDATMIKKKISYVVTDLPYGRATKTINKKELYLAFLKNLKKILTKRAVIVFPHYVPYKELIKKSKLKKVKEYTVYIHKTLTRKIVVVEA